MQQSQENASLIKFITKLSIHSSPIKRTRTMSDESDWSPLPDDPSVLLSKEKALPKRQRSLTENLEEAGLLSKISDTK